MMNERNGTRKNGEFHREKGESLSIPDWSWDGAVYGQMTIILYIGLDL